VIFASSSLIPIIRKEIAGGFMPREAIPTWFFAVVVVRKEDRFLIVHERRHGQLWYLPAGRVEPGETFVAAAVRETLEEAGIPIRVTGILRVEHTPGLNGSRLRVVFLAEPLDDTPPKTVPDEESLGAAWVRLDELGRHPLRGFEVEELFAYVAAGGPVYPPELLQLEGMPYAWPG
jgi:phosphatase NudJ